MGTLSIEAPSTCKKKPGFPFAWPQRGRQDHDRTDHRPAVPEPVHQVPPEVAFHVATNLSEAPTPVGNGSVIAR
jgi:hypothetical protein